jgi:N-methylhydantoinase A
MQLVAVDVGGTHTDLYAWLDGDAANGKVPTTTDDPTVGAVDAVERAGIDLGSVDYFLHGSTITTNALIEGDYPSVALVTTEGFRDVVEIGRYHREKLYDPYQRKPEPLVPRRHRFEVRERVAADGTVRTPVDEATVDGVLEALRAGDFESVAVGFINSYANPEHEQLVADAIEDATDLYVARSSAVSPTLGSLERFSTAVVNAALAPLVRDYLERLRERLASLGFEGRFLVIASNGGVLEADRTADHAETTVLSGPAAGAKGAGLVGEARGQRNVIGMDMGGTSTDVSLVEEGEPLSTTEYEVQFDVPVSAPMVDVTTIGSGGGTIAWVDEGGSLRVGPKSAGADPGPAAYPNGGDRPTITDANLVLGRLDPEAFLGGEMVLDVDAAEAAVGELGAGLGLDPLETATGILEIATENMAAAIRELTVERGRDPRDYDLVGFGGCGPMHAVDVAGTLAVPRVVVPAAPGVLSAFAATMMDLQYDAAASYHAPVEEVDPAALEAAFDDLEREARTPLESDHGEDGAVGTDRVAEMRYVGQTYELDVPLPDGELTAETLASLVDRFHDVHETEYGVSNRDFAVEFVTLRVRASAAFVDVSPPNPGREGVAPDPRTREVCFGGTWYEASVYDRSSLPPDAELETPTVVEDATATVVVDPGTTARTDAHGNVVVETEGGR